MASPRPAAAAVKTISDETRLRADHLQNLLKIKFVEKYQQAEERRFAHVVRTKKGPTLNRLADAKNFDEFAKVIEECKTDFAQGQARLLTDYASILSKELSYKEREDEINNLFEKNKSVFAAFANICRETAIYDMSKRYEKTSQEMQDQHKTVLADQQKTHATALADQQKTHQTALSTKESEFSAAFKKQQETASSVLGQVARELDAARVNERTLLAKLQTCDQQLERLSSRLFQKELENTTLSNAIDILKVQHQVRSASYEAEINDLKRKLDTATTAHEKARHTYAVRTQRLLTQVKASKAETAAAKSETQTARDQRYVLEAALDAAKKGLNSHGVFKQTGTPRASTTPQAAGPAAIENKR